jgi:hypothetical protein
MHRVYLSPCACEAETDTGCLHLLLCIRGDSQTQEKAEEGGRGRVGKGGKEPERMLRLVRVDRLGRVRSVHADPTRFIA